MQRNHYGIRADGSKRYLSTSDARGKNLIESVRRLQATLADAPIRDYTYLVLHPRTALALDCLDDPRVTVAAQVAVDACDSDTAYKGAQWALSISLVGLVGLAAWAILSL